MTCHNSLAIQPRVWWWRLLATENNCCRSIGNMWRASFAVKQALSVIHPLRSLLVMACRISWLFTNRISLNLFIELWQRARSLSYSPLRHSTFNRYHGQGSPGWLSNTVAQKPGHSLNYDTLACSTAGLRLHWLESGTMAPPACTWPRMAQPNCLVSQN